MAEHSDLIAEALDCLKAGGFTLGTGWNRAHEIAQDHEGIADFDWLHALCHRIEGDDRNAAYWYRRAGRERGQGTAEEECAAMRAALR
ncbi:MAG: hypothetical protein CL535_04505 [Ahrensia sp.]|nr:hypothetical protein [Ahrensia sp.]